MAEHGKLLIFHHSDLDGMGVKLVGMLYGQLKGYELEDIETFKCNYGDIDDIIKKRLDEEPHMITEILIGDISVQSQEVARILEAFYKKIPVNLLDHHATATWLNNYFWAKVRERDDEGVERCGTYWVAYELLSPTFLQDNENVLSFIQLVDMYDTWKWMADPDCPVVDADNLNSVFKMFGEDEFTDYMYPRLINNSEVFSDTTEMIVNMRNRQLDSRARGLNKDMKVCSLNFDTKHHPECLTEMREFYAEYYKDNPERTRFAQKYLTKDRYKETFKVGIVFDNHDISDLGNRLLDMHPELDLIMFVCLPKLMSYRSRKELNVPLGVIAKYMTGRGGGHPCSAGGSLNPSRLVSTLQHSLFTDGKLTDFVE